MSLANSPKETIGQFFKSYRESCQHGIAEVADYLKVGSETILGYEHGDQKIPLEHVFALANLYSIPPDRVVSMFYEIVCEVEATKSLGTGS